MAKELQLQGIGKREATEARNVKVGDVLVWNYGYEEVVKSIEFSKTGKTMKVVIEAHDGKEYTRKMNAGRLVCVA